ncbi:MAG: hypothetical protein VCA55_08510, partial [Verrucomicrobiales bacterium]
MCFRSLLILNFLSLLALSATAAPRKILFIGNSYTGQVRSAAIRFFAASPQKEIRLEFITPGGKTLKQHSEEALTMDRISGGGWDVVVLQDQSQTPAIFPEKFLSASKRLHQ